MENTTYTQKGKEFDAKKINKYFKNQELPSNFDEPYTDEIFPPNKNSLMSLDENGEPSDPEQFEKKKNDLEEGSITWKRLSEVFPDSQVFEGEIECNDVKQGNLGNCYFLAALAALTEFPNLIFKIFKTNKFSKIGCYEIAFFIDGEWQMVIIDDFIPMNDYGNGKPVPAFAKPNGDELWVMLLEKAWAKVNGGYLNIIGGKPTDCLSTFTGFSKKLIYTKNEPEWKIWEIVEDADRSDNILCCSTKEKIEENGLVANHAYTLISAIAAEVDGEEIRLVKLRNPWGSKEWKGKWSDDSDLWNENTIKLFERGVAKNDGTFYMSIEDFCEYFGYIYICYTIYGANIKIHNFMEENISLNTAQVFSLNIKTDASDCTIQVNAPYFRFNRHLKNKHIPISLILAKVNSDGTFDYLDGDSATIDDPSVKRLLDQGNYVIWVYLGQNESQERHFENINLKISNNSRFVSNYEKDDSDFGIMREILISGVKKQEGDNIKNAKNGLILKKSRFAMTGIGYYFCFNTTPYYYKVSVDTENILNMNMLSPNSGKFDMYGPPDSILTVFAIMQSDRKTYNFTIDCDCTTSYSAFPDDPDEGKDNQFSNSNQINAMSFLNKEFLSQDVEDDFYNYIFPTNENAKIKMSFKKLDEKELPKEKLEKEFPDYMQKLNDIPDEDKYSENLWKKIDYESGFYLGQVDSKGERTGKGVWITSSGLVSAGYFKSNERNGYFNDYDVDGRLKYEGYYLKGNRNGKGKFMYSDGSYYFGDFKNNTFHGKGEYHYENGSVYIGDYICGKYNGKGKTTFTDGSYHKGQYVDNEYNGHGEYHFENGMKYIGNYSNGKYNGKGKLIYSENSYYEGEFKDSVITGYGEMLYSSGTKYIGEWVNSAREGKGRYYYNELAYWDGEFSNNQLHGTGIYHGKDGSSRTIIYEHGKELKN